MSDLFWTILLFTLMASLYLSGVIGHLFCKYVRKDDS
jgi:hypothetical protein